MIAYHFFYITQLPYEPSVNAIVHLAFACSIILLNYLAEKVNPLHFLMLLISIGAGFYFFTHYELILEDPSYPPMSASIAGILSGVVVVYLTYKAFGWIFPIVTLVGVLYMWKGSMLPALKAPSIDIDRMITLLASDVTSPWGLYGNLLILSANYLFLFVLFGSVLEAFGGLRFVITAGSWAASFFRSGAAALSIFSSALLGSLTGSTVANITITGTFTIPLMKKTGYSAEQAAAIETAASSGGQILPPVMGATVFVMSGFTGIPYISIVKASVFAALIYFTILLVYAEINARKRNIQIMKGDPIDVRVLLLSAPVFLGPLSLLLCLLMVGLSLMKTIMYCLIAAAALGIFMNFLQKEKLVWKDVIRQLAAGAASGSQVAVVLAMIGVAVACVEVTGLGMKLGSFLVQLSMNNLHILLCMTALTALVLGIGLPSPAAYIICATILSPALVSMGVPLLQAHLFPLYFAIFSHLTPPVGIGLMVACKMAGSDYIKSAGEALKAAFPCFVLPFLFVYSPGILLKGETLMEDTTAIIGTLVFFIALAVFGSRFFACRLTLGNEIGLGLGFMCLAAFMTVWHNSFLLLAGIVILVIALYVNVLYYRKSLAAERVPLPEEGVL